jgi:D-inositol-3-phosphate glycosyltransferase
VRRLAILSMHTCPLAQPGTGDGGGMNVYVRELAAALARSGIHCDVYTRASSPDELESEAVEPGFVVHHVEAGPRAAVPKERLPSLVEDFAAGVAAHIARLGDDGPEAIHANYWLSGVAGHALKHELGLPLVCTFHTLDRVKAECSAEEVAAAEPARRAAAEAEVIACSDAVLASCSVEAAQLRSLYDAEPGRIAVMAPGVDHAIFGPGNRRQARRAVRQPEDEPLLLFAGRIQPLKGADLALETLALLEPRLRASGRRGSPPRLAVVGGPSGPHGEEAAARLRERASLPDLAGRVDFVPPQPHELLSTWYRAADVCLVPSRSESFGLVALEAAACGTPVVAAEVGGLRSLVDHGRTGFLVPERRAEDFASYVERILSDQTLATAFSRAAARRARRYTWAAAAARLRLLLEELTERQLVECG